MPVLGQPSWTNKFASRHPAQQSSSAGTQHHRGTGVAALRTCHHTATHSRYCGSPAAGQSGAPSEPTIHVQSSGLIQRSQFADRVHSSRLLPTLSRTVLSARGTERGRPYCCVLQWQDRSEPSQQSSMAAHTGGYSGCASSPLSSATCQQAHSHSRLAGMSDKAHNFQRTIFSRDVAPLPLIAPSPSKARPSLAMSSTIGPGGGGAGAGGAGGGPCHGGGGLPSQWSCQV